MPARKGGHEIFAEIGKTGLTNAAMRGIIYLAFAGVAHLVERDLAKVEVASSSLVARSKKNTPSDRMGYSFWNVPRAGWNSLPRPARSASNPEVKAGLPRMALPFVGCREASSSLVYFTARARKIKKNHPLGGFSFWNAAGRMELAASTCAQRGEPFRRGRRPRRPVSAAVRRWERIPTLLRAAKQRALGVLLGMTGVWVYRHAATIRQDGVSFLTVPGETPASGRAAPPTPRRSAPAGRPGRR